MICILLLLFISCIIIFIQGKKKKGSLYDDLSYDELLKCKEWEAKKKEILLRDNHQCQWCGQTRDLNIHHKYYLKYPNHKFVLPWEYNNDALITLCNRCHKRCHQRYPNKVYYTKYIK